MANTNSNDAVTTTSTTAHGRRNITMEHESHELYATAVVKCTGADNIETTYRAFDDISVKGGYIIGSIKFAPTLPKQLRLGLIETFEASMMCSIFLVSLIPLYMFGIWQSVTHGCKFMLTLYKQIEPEIRTTIPHGYKHIIVTIDPGLEFKPESPKVFLYDWLYDSLFARSPIRLFLYWMLRVWLAFLGLLAFAYVPYVSYTVHPLIGTVIVLFYIGHGFLMFAALRTFVRRGYDKASILYVVGLLLLSGILALISIFKSIIKMIAVPCAIALGIEIE